MRSPSFLIPICFYKHNRFLILTASLVFFFACYPLVENTTIALFVLNLLFKLILFSAIFAISGTLKPLIVSLSLALLIIALDFLYQYEHLKFWELSELYITVFFWSYIATHILKFILKQQVINSELIFAAIAVYLILGIIWASIYQVIELSHPHSFAVANPEIVNYDLSFQMWYFSMVTLTTLGYGDIAPVTMFSRVFVVLEAIFGQLYLAILIASLVGRSISNTRSSHE